MNISNNYKLVVNNKECILAETEYYEYSDEHPDIFTHRDPEQKQNMTWYFHKMNGSYKGGTYKGLDITMGNENKYCGILIRALYTGNTFIEGPCNCVNFILKETKTKSIIELVEKMNNFNVIDNNCVKLVPINENREIYRCPRVGITLNNKRFFEQKKYYVCKNYRGMLYPHLQKKSRELIVCGLYSQGYELDDIINITKMKKNICKRYIDNYKKGETMDIKTLYGRKLKINEMCQMIGCINSLE